MRRNSLVCLGVELFFAALCLVGCQAGPQYFPAQIGKTWQYRIQQDRFEPYSDRVRLARQVSVDGKSGVEMLGGMTNARLAWSGETLIASEMGNLRFRPALPLLDKKIGFLDPTKPEANQRVTTMPWTGVLTHFGQDSEAKAELSQELDEVMIAGRNCKCVKTTLQMRIGPAGKSDEQMTLTTWFQAGIGIVKQQQHKGRNLVVSVELMTSAKV